MRPLGMLGLAAATQFAAALLFCAPRRLSFAPRVALFAVCELVIFASPAMVPARAPFLRLVAGIIGVMVAVKLHDLRNTPPGQWPGAMDLIVYLSNPFTIVWRKAIAAGRHGAGRDLRRIFVGSIASIACVFLLIRVFEVDWTRFPFVVEHAAKIIALFLVVLVFPNTLAAAYRLAGFAALDLCGNFFLARTPSEFWRRYNRPAGQYLHEDIFKPLGGRRRPVAGTLLVFAYSGLVHEYVFDLGASRVMGWQLAFFLIQGIAAAASLRVRPTGWSAVAGVVLTFAFNLATALLFFASVNAVMPFYCARGR